MDPSSSHAWEAIISSAVVPVVIISACGLLCLAFQNRLQGVVSRLRSLQRERLAEYREIMQQKQQETDHYLHSLEKQTVQVLKRARFLRLCLLGIISSIISLVLCSFFVGMSVWLPALDAIALVFFIVGLFLLLFGLGFALCEVAISLKPVESETALIQQIVQSEFSNEK